MQLPTNSGILTITHITSPSSCFIYLQNQTRFELLFAGFFILYLQGRVVSNNFFPAQEIVQEQITRVLLERLIVNKPHPWGLLITFIELIKVSFLVFAVRHHVEIGLADAHELKFLSCFSFCYDVDASESTIQLLESVIHKMCTRD